MKRTKILATLGPASSTRAILRAMIRRGADGFRINFSHGDRASHRQLLEAARAAGARAGRETFVVADLQGPKIRLGEIAPSPSVLARGAEFRLDRSTAPGGPGRATLEIPDFPRAARSGDPVLLGDGDVELRVTSVDAGGIVTRVVEGGPIRSHMGVYLPNARLRTSILGSKDREDLAFALAHGVDYVALSFVREAGDLRAARALAARLPSRGPVGWIAKIERAEALRDIDAILSESDGIMVARGDLGIEVPLERLALEQKRLVERARRAGKPSIVATQMLLSMVDAPRPTRAEATDVANAVIDGADAVMLSEESAIGHHPVEAVGWLDRIARRAEASGLIPALRGPSGSGAREAAEQAVADAAVRLAEDLSAGAIVTPTHSGRTARWVSSRRSGVPVIALSSQAETLRRLALVWGVTPVRVARHLDLLHLRSTARRAAERIDGGNRRRPLVLTAGYPIEGRPTNLLTVVEAEPTRVAPVRAKSRRR